MTQKWYPVQRLDGQFGAHVDFKFSTKEHAELMAIVGKYENAEKFIFTVSFMVGSAKAFKTHSENCKPGIVRDRLRKIKKITDALIKNLTELDDLSKDLIESSSIMTFQQVTDSSTRLCTIAKSALLLSEGLSNKPEDFAKKHLACDLASAIEFYFGASGVRPTKTHGEVNRQGVFKEGLYAKCLKIVLPAAGFYCPDDTYRLSDKGDSALNNLKSQPCDNSEFEVDTD